MKFMCFSFFISPLILKFKTKKSKKMSHKFEEFLQTLKKPELQQFQLQEVLVDLSQISWTFFVAADEFPSEAALLDEFRKHLQEFIKVHTEEVVKNISCHVCYEFHHFNYLKDEQIWEKQFQYILQKKKTEANESFLDLFNSTPTISWEDKKVVFRLNPILLKYFHRTDILKELNTFFIHRYGIDLEFITEYPDLLTLSELKDPTIDGFNDLVKDELTSEEKFKINLINIIAQKQENEIYKILDQTPLIDVEKKTCEFDFPPYLKNILTQLDLLPSLQKLFEEEHQCFYQFRNKGDVMAEKRQQQWDHNELPLISFKDIPIQNSALKTFKQNNPAFRVKGYVQQVTELPIKNNQSVLVKFFLVDPETKQDSIEYKSFFNQSYKGKTNTFYTQIKKDFQEGVLVEIETFVDFNAKNQEYYFNFTPKNATPKYQVLDNMPLMYQRQDDYPDKKRIEFHLHTKMSNLDAVTSVKDYLDIAEKWGHEALAFTDHNGVYAFPEIEKHLRGKKIKPILGAEFDFIAEKPLYITNQEQYPQFPNFTLKNHKYVVFDLETTGFSKIRDKIIEISAVRIENGKITEEMFDELVDPQTKLNPRIKEITQITNQDLEGKPTIDAILPKFLDFAKGYTLIAHNASFDMDFLLENVKKLSLSYEPQPVIDTMPLSQKYFHQFLKFFSLKRLAKVFKAKPISEGHSHRALYDSETTALVYIEMMKKLEEQKVLTFYDLKGAADTLFERSYHVNVLAKNQTGYQDLFYLISDSLTQNFYKKPRLLKSKLNQHRENLLVGSGCFDSNVFETALNKSEQDLAEAIAFYDYIEVQPLNAYKHVIYDLGGDDPEIDALSIVQNTLLKIINEARKQGKIIIATGDVHYLHHYEKIYREMYINAKLIGGGLHKLSKFSSENLPDNHLLTTQEMLDAFSFIEDELLRKDLVINNPHLLNQQIDKIQIFPQQLFSLQDDTFAQNLKVPSIKQEMKVLITTRIEASYGKIVHPLIQERIDKELKSILGDDNQKDANQSITPIYYLSYLLVKKSMEDGYSVGSRGSIGSSIIANVLEITEVNPLRPHYNCPKCQYTVIKMTEEEKQNPLYKKYVKKDDPNDYDILEHTYSGYDLPDKKCFQCNVNFSKNGQDIPFETFLGFEGNKTPDIDLNFAGDYQSKAHDYIKELLGEEQVFRAGTIQTVAKRNAYGYVKGFVKDKGLDEEIRVSEISRRSVMIEGVKRSTGQHPGGIVVVPKGHKIYEITPVQYPADDTESKWRTTHFDYHSFENNLFKMDILGHDDPMLIKFFMDYVKKNPSLFPFDRYQDIPLDDIKVYELFANKDKNKTSIAVPEFGTNFVIAMLKDIYDKEKKTFNFSTLVKVSGLSHGTNVWTQNAKDILAGKGDFQEDIKTKISFDEVIACRDEIMNTLIAKGVDSLRAFDIMEFVRKGKPHTHPQEWKKLISPIEAKIPQWYLKSLNKIKYLFPKAHAAAYVLMAMRIAWFKVNHPLLFYSGYFSKRADQFDYNVMLKTAPEIEKELRKADKNPDDEQITMKKTVKKELTAKEQNRINTLKSAYEMVQLGYQFLPIDLNKSEANEFMIENDKALRMPFVAIDGLGQVAADNIVMNRKEKLFTQNDFVKRVKINKTILKKFKDEMIIERLPEE